MSGKPRHTMTGLAAWAMLATMPACLGNSYVIPAHVLEAERKVAPAKRGGHLRVVQRFSTATDPPPAPRWQSPPPDHARAAEAHPDGDLNGMAWWWWWGPPHVRYYPASYRPLDANGAPTAGAVGPDGAVAGGRSGGGGGTAASGVGKALSSEGTDTKAAIAVAIVAGTAVGIGLAMTEGARYDGWVAVHPSHPVHIMGWSGRSRLLPLWQAVDQGLAAGEEAVIVRHEGAGMWMLGRAPLDREGFTYGFDLSSQYLPLRSGGSAQLTGGTLEFGVWPVPWAGVVAGALMGWGSDPAGLAIARVQPRVELQVMPLNLWRLHLGGLAAMGHDTLWRDAAGTSESQVTSSLGPMLQIDLTTRLAMTLRWQWSWAHGNNLPVSQAFGVGLSIY